MTLGELIATLRAESRAVVLKNGFKGPHSYRGDYSQLAFEPATNMTIRQLLRQAEGALGQTFKGWKGGDYLMTEDTEVWLADRGCLGEMLGPTLLNYMLKDEIGTKIFRVQVERLETFTIEVAAGSVDEVGEAALDAESSGVGVIDTQISVDVLHDTIEEVTHDDEEAKA